MLVGDVLEVIATPFSLAVRYICWFNFGGRASEWDLNLLILINWRQPLVLRLAYSGFSCHYQKMRRTHNVRKTKVIAITFYDVVKSLAIL